MWHVVALTLLLCCYGVRATSNVSVRHHDVARLLNGENNGRKLLAKRHYVCVVYSPKNYKLPTYGIHSESLKKCPVKLPKNYYSLCVCNSNAKSRLVCRAYAYAVSYVVHFPKSKDKRQLQKLVAKINRTNDCYVGGPSNPKSQTSTTIVDTGLQVNKALVGAGFSPTNFYSPLSF